MSTIYKIAMAVYITSIITLVIVIVVAVSWGFLERWWRRM